MPFHSYQPLLYLMIRTVDLPLQFPEHLLKPDTVLDVLLHQVLLGLPLLEAPVIAFGVI